MSKKTDYLDEVYRLAIQLGIPEPQARLAAAQSGVETGYGKHAPGNAYFGMKAGSSWNGPTQTLKTHEEQNGALVAINDKFRVYDSKAASLQDWWSRLQARWPEAAAATTFDGAVAGLNYGKPGGYATDTKYGSKLRYADNMLAPRPPMNIPGVGTELSVGAGSVGQSIGGSAAPPPLPRARPEPRRVTNIPDGAMYGVRGNTGPTAIPAMTAPVADMAGAFLAGPQDRMMMMARPQVTPPPPIVAPTMGDTRVEMRPTPGMVRQFPPPPVARPGAGLGAVAGMGAIAGGANGVIPPNPNMPRYVPPALPRVGPAPPVVPPAPLRPVAPQVAMPPPTGGFDFGAALGGLGSNIQAGLTNTGQALGTAANNAIEGTRSAISNTTQSAGDLLKNELIGTVKGRTLLFNTALGLPAPGTHNSTRYGDTFAERQEAARRREAMAYGLPYVPPQTGVRSQLSITPPRMPAPRSTNRPPPRNSGRWEGVLDEFGMII